MVYGVGIYNSGEYTANLDGKNSKPYSRWKAMLSRCYNPNDKCYASYGGKGVKVCQEWLYFQTFAEWHRVHYKEGYHLDKDILVYGNKLYSPDTCRYIPKTLNTLLINTTAESGVTFNKRLRKYVAQLSVNRDRIHLGTFDDIDDARHIYQRGKTIQILETALRLLVTREIDHEVFKGVLVFVQNNLPRGLEDSEKAYETLGFVIEGLKKK